MRIDWEQWSRIELVDHVDWPECEGLCVVAREMDGEMEYFLANFTKHYWRDDLRGSMLRSEGVWEFYKEADTFTRAMNGDRYLLLTREERG
jgi:hypothetical protein